MAFTFLVPAGCVYDPADASGLAAFTCEMALRGAGPSDSRQFVEATGKPRGGAGRVRFRQPHQFRRRHAEQELVAGLGDLRAICFDGRTYRRNRSRPVEQWYYRNCEPLRMSRPKRSCWNSVADNIQIPGGGPAREPVRLWNRSISTPSASSIKARMARKARSWAWQVVLNGRACETKWGGCLEIGTPRNQPPSAPNTQLSRREHLTHESNQTQIGVAYPSLPYRDPDYFQAWGAVGVLSGGMSSRLFTEVREKRGLCYSVYASYHSSLRDRASVLCYAGTGAERAQETLDVMLAELQRLADGH